MTLLIIFFVLSIVISFICSIMEAVLLSITPSFVNKQKRESPSLGARLEKYKEDIDRPLSAILTLNTIAHTVGAIGVGAQAGQAFGETLINIPFVDFQISYESLVAGLMTLAILILSEIIPKTLGANYWRRLTPVTDTALRVIMFLLYPFVQLSILITKYMKSSEVHSVLSREDYKVMTNLGNESGALEQNESLIINNLLNLDTVLVKDIMTPRIVIHAVKDSTTLQEYYDNTSRSTFSRIPIYKNKMDDIEGFVLKDEILAGIIEGKGSDTLESLKRDISFVSENATLKDFFIQMTNQNQHLAVANDQFGSINGLASLEDVLETLLGFEITDETDKVEDLQAYARKKWEERAKNLGILNTGDKLD